MKNISIRSTLVLSILGILAIIILATVENTKSLQKQKFYSEKIAASKLSSKMQKHVKNTFFANEISIDNINDPNDTGLVGPQFSPITSGRGDLPVKLSTMNPNFSAMIVHLITKAGLKEGDAVGVCFTGSYPGLNIATCAAIETLGLKPILIGSLASSSWGANDPELTWIEIHKSLFDAQLVSSMPVAASLGGGQDIGRTLSREGREILENKILSNNITYINEGSLEGNIQKRMEIFTKENKLKLFINIGEGIASLGSDENAMRLGSGLKTNLKIKKLPHARGVVYEMVRKKIPYINLSKISELMSKYGLPADPVPLPEIGDGDLFMSQKYNLPITWLSTLVFIALIIAVMYYDKKQNALGTKIIKTK